VKLRTFRRTIAWASALLAIAGGQVDAMEKPRPGQVAQYRLDGTFDARLANALAIGNQRADPSLPIQLQLRLQRLGLGVQPPSGGALPGGIHPALPSKGTVKIFALLIDFSDYPSKFASSVVYAGMFGDGVAAAVPYESLRNYYRRSSYNQLEIQGVTLGWYRPAYGRAAVVQTQAGREDLIKEALNSFNATTDFSQFDNDGDGKIDYFSVFWTGPDTGWGNFWWGYNTGWTSSFTLDGKQFQGTKYSWQWASENEGTTFTPLTVIHETGHSLGLPDLYDYDPNQGPDGGVGYFDMMDDTSGDHNAFSKMLLDWVTPVVAVNGRTYTLHPSGTTGEAVIMWPGYVLAAPFTEFFIVQNRARVGNDADPYGCPGEGLVVWHIDARLNASNQFAWDNSVTAHKLVRLMEADGLEEIEAGFSARASDFYGTGSRLGNDTTPNSHAYDGSVTLVGVDSVVVTGSAGNTVASFVAGDTVSRLMTNPESAVVGEGGTTTFQVKLSLAPTGTTSVSVAWDSGDPDIQVAGGSVLTFTTSNWNTWQTVTLSAGVDDNDILDGTTTIRLAATGYSTKYLVATERDDDISYATYNATFKTPACSSALAGCDSQTLLRSRASIRPMPEANQPNTLYDTCADGIYGGYKGNESIEAIRITAADGTIFTPGKTVQVQVTVYAYSAGSDYLDLYYTGDATVNPPAWTFLTTLRPAGTGIQVLSTTYVLPAGSVQALRANFRFGGSAAVCAGGLYSGGYDDHDDLVFATRLNPTITLVIHDASHNTVTGASIGTMVHGHAAVTGTGPAPTGTVTFGIWSNHTCSGLVPANGAALNSGVAESWTQTQPATGSAFTAYYNGDASYAPRLASCTPVPAYAAAAFTDPVLTPRVTWIKAVHITELRSAIATLRNHFQLAAATWTDPDLTGGKPITAIHLTELREALRAVYQKIGRTPPSYAHATITPRSTSITAADIAEIRVAIAAIW
jgi:M6 family metalloprotease-like protein